MKCALNNGNLYKTWKRYACVGCIFEKYNNANLCKKVNLCSFSSILKRNHNQSDIFKI